MAEEKLTLFELEGQFKQALDLSDEDTELFIETLESMEFFENVGEKLDGYGYFLKDLKGRQDVEKAKADIIKKTYSEQMQKVTAIDNKIKYIKTKLYDFLKLTDQKKVKTENFSFWYQSNPASLELLDKEKIPKSFYSLKLDEAKIKQALKNGVTVEGAELVKSESLRFK